MKISQLFFWFLVLLIIESNLFLLRWPMQAEADAYIRHNESFLQFTDQRLISFHQVWLPAHFTILALSFLIIPDALLAPRLLTVLTSLATSVVIYLYARRVYHQSSGVAMLTVLLFLLFPLRLFLSVQTLSETFLGFFLLLSLVALLHERPWLRVSLISLAIAQALRFESWFIVPLMWYFVLSHQSLSRYQKSLFLGASLLFPLSWMTLTYVKTGSPLAFFFRKIELAHVREYYSAQYYNLLSATNNWVYRLVEVLGYFPLLTLVIGWTQRVRQRLTSYLVIALSLPLYLLLLLIAQVFLGTMEWQPHRYLYLPILLSLPLIAEGLSWIYQKITTLSFSLAPLVIILIAYVGLEYASLLVTNYHLVTRYFTNHQTEIFEIVASLTPKLQPDQTTSVYYLFAPEPVDWKFFSHAFQYFLTKDVTELYQTDMAANQFDSANAFIIMEKSSRGELLPEIKNSHPIIETDTFKVVRVSPPPQ